MRSRPIVLALVVVLSLLTIGISPASLIAESEQELRGRIGVAGTKIEEIEREIERYEIELDEVQNEKRTLSGAIRTIDITRRKLNAEIDLTRKRVSGTNSEISELGSSIAAKTVSIERSVESMAGSLRHINEVTSRSMIEVLLSSESISSGLVDVDDLEILQSRLSQNVSDLHEEREGLVALKLVQENNKAHLLGLQDTLNDQKYIEDQNKREKAELLKVTENKESSYEKLIDEKVGEKEAFEAELRDFEAQLKLVLDKSKLPSPGSGVLSWPIEDIYVTQYFGDTSFARSRPQIYSSKGHNGIDLRASVGTEILSAASGVVAGIGNTDDTCRNASYGKWVLVGHDNGLATLYAHLSLIKVSKGDRVERGSLLAYSGNTGYSTGPHLHFSVYAKEGVRVDTLPSRACGGKSYTIPLSPLGGYLNPISYLVE